MPDLERLVWKPDQPFDVILFWVTGVFENNDVPPLWLIQRVGELAYQNPISIERSVVSVVHQIQRVDIPTIGTDPGHHHIIDAATRSLPTRSDLKRCPTFVTHNIFVRSHQSGCH